MRKKGDRAVMRNRRKGMSKKAKKKKGDQIEEKCREMKKEKGILKKAKRWRMGRSANLY